MSTSRYEEVWRLVFAAQFSALWSEHRTPREVESGHRHLYDQPSAKERDLDERIRLQAVAAADLAAGFAESERAR